MFSLKEKDMVAKLLMATYNTNFSMEIQWFLTCFDSALPSFFSSPNTITHQWAGPSARSCLECFPTFFLFLPFLPLEYTERRVNILRLAASQKQRDFSPAGFLWSKGKACAKDVKYCHSVCNQRVCSQIHCALQRTAYNIQLTLLATQCTSSQKHWKLGFLLNTMHF